MASGSYFTIFRKSKSITLPATKLEMLKAEYMKMNSSLFKEEDDKSSNVPLLMQEDFTYSDCEIDKAKSNNYYDKDGVLHEKLLTFDFCSTFTCLKEKFNLNAYKNSECSVMISKDEARKMLQAIKYVLSGEYSKKFEDILNNEYVQLFGNGYSLFDNRFSKHKDKIYVDKDGNNGYSISFGDERWDAEIAESDDDILFNLTHTQSCLQAFLDASCCSFDDFELVLEYVAW